MNLLFVLIMVCSFVYTVLGDWKNFKKESLGGKAVYGLLGTLVLVLLLAGVFDLDVMYPTKAVIYGMAPYIREMMRNVQ